MRGAIEIGSSVLTISSSGIICESFFNQLSPFHVLLGVFPFSIVPSTHMEMLNVRPTDDWCESHLRLASVVDGRSRNNFRKILQLAWHRHGNLFPRRCQ